MFKIMIESNYASLPFNGFKCIADDGAMRIYESVKDYYENDADYRIQVLYEKHPSSIYNIGKDDIGARKDGFVPIY